jgi:hypothetical protein
VPRLIGLEGVEEGHLQRVDERVATRGAKLVSAAVDESDDAPELVALPREPRHRLTATPAVQPDQGALEKPPDIDPYDLVVVFCAPGGRFHR